MISFLIALLAAALGGAANALAGGGTFMVFPALLYAGLPPVSANATSSLVLMPGGFASAWVYRDTLRDSSPRFVWSMLSVSLAGAGLGSVLLLRTPNAKFAALVPWLLLGATTVFSLAPWIRKVAVRASGHQSMGGLLAGQFAISVYGGYFGAGMGVLMIALYLVATKLDVRQASALRLACAVTLNVLTVTIFAWRGALDYRLGVPMLLAGIAGGYVGAILVKRLNADKSRLWILVYAWGLTAFFFVRRMWG